MEPLRGSDHYWRDWTLQDGITGGYFYAGIDFAQAYRNGSRFTFLKACDGLYPTRFFGDAYNDAIEAGIMTGAYLWLDAGIFADVRKQAEFWYAQIKHVPCVSIDFEVFEDNAPNAADLWGAATRLRELGYSGKLLVYSNWSYWLEHANDSPAWLTLFDGIWLADPDSIPQAPYWAPPSEKTRRAPAPFPDWQFHQFSWTGDPAKYGVTNGKLAIDENNFNGDETQLEQFFGGAVTPPPPNGGTMFQGTCITASLYVRNAPVTGGIVGGLKLNDVVEADRIENGWWHLTKIRGAATVGENWSYEGATKNYIRTDATPPPPPPAGLPVIHVHLEAAGYPAFDGDWTPNAS